MNRKVLQLSALFCIISIAFASAVSAEDEQDQGRVRGNRQRNQMRNPRIQNQPGGPIRDQRSPRGGEQDGRRGGGMQDRAMAPGMGMGAGMGSTMRIEMLSRALNLSDEQNLKIQKAQEANLDKTNELENKLVELQSEIALAVIDGDKEKANKLAAQIGETTGKAASLRVDAQQAIVKELNEEQLEKFKTIQNRQKEMIKTRLQRHQRMQEQRSEKGERGKNDRPERGNRPSGPELGTFLQNKDANNDGTITLEEFKAGSENPKKQERFFNMLDLNNDGKLTKDEIEKISSDSRRVNPDRRGR